MKQSYPTSTAGYSSGVPTGMQAGHQGSVLGAGAQQQQQHQQHQQQKPIRTVFKVPAEGVYKLAEEIVFTPPFKGGQRKFFPPLPQTKISFAFVQDGNVVNSKELYEPQSSIKRGRSKSKHSKDALQAAGNHSSAPTDVDPSPSSSSSSTSTSTSSTTSSTTSTTPPTSTTSTTPTVSTNNSTTTNTTNNTPNTTNKTTTTTTGGGHLYVGLNYGEAIGLFVSAADNNSNNPLSFNANNSNNNNNSNNKDSSLNLKDKQQPLTCREQPTCLAFGDPSSSSSSSPSSSDHSSQPSSTSSTTTSRPVLDLLIGFASGDLLLYEPGKTPPAQYNKDRSLATGQVTGVAWVPGAAGEFVASFASGVLLFMHSARDDQPASSLSKPEPPDSFCVVRQKNPKYNPVSKWCISSKAINGFSFSPSGKYIAVACQDGFLRIFDCEDETMLVAFRSYYGGFTCCAWSPDGKYLASGGEDDLVCIWAPHERSLLARGQGHRSWVSEVKFDPWNCAVGPNNSTYRIASVGEDTKLLLWDFERGTLRRPRNMSMSFSSRRVGDFKHTLSQVQSQVQAQQSQPQTNHHAEQYKAPIIESRGRQDVPQIHPLVEHRTHFEPVSDVHFLQKYLVTCASGKAKFWARPGHLPPSPSQPAATPTPSSSASASVLASALASTSSLLPAVPLSTSASTPTTSTSASASTSTPASSTPTSTSTSTSTPTSIPKVQSTSASTTPTPTPPQQNLMP